MKWKKLCDKYLKSGELLKLIKFALTGVANTLVDYLVFIILTSALGINIYFAQICSYSAGMLNSYFVNRSWTFRSNQNFFSWQMAKFIITNLIFLLLSIVLLKLFVEFLALPALLAKLLVVAITMIVNFIISRLWVFAK